MPRFQPMLAKAPEPDKYPLRLPLLVSPKLDGIRCVITPEGARTRRLKPLPNVELSKRLSIPELVGLDGELVAGAWNDPHTMQKTTSAVMSFEGDADSVTFFVFDYVDCFESPSSPFRQRLAEAARIVRRQGSGLRVEILDHSRVDHLAELDYFESSYVASGFEGAMIRDPLGLYKFGRATAKERTLLKLKRWEHAEGRVVAVYEREHNENEQTRDERGYAKRSTAKAGKRAAGTFGGVTVELGPEWEESTVDIATGIGWTDEERARLWAKRDSLIGQIARYKFQPHGAKDAPRIPIWDAWRHPDDMS